MPGERAVQNWSNLCSVDHSDQRSEFGRTLLKTLDPAKNLMAK